MIVWLRETRRDALKLQPDSPSEWVQETASGQFSERYVRPVYETHINRTPSASLNLQLSSTEERLRNQVLFSVINSRSVVDVD